MASKRCFGSQASASARTMDADRPVRLRLALSNSNRRFDRSSAVTRQSCAASCKVLPPGAAHRSSTWRPSPAPSNLAGIEAARSCTHQSPDSKPLKASTLSPRASRRCPGKKLSAANLACHSCVSSGFFNVRSSGGGTARPCAIGPARSPQRRATSAGKVGLSGKIVSRLARVENTPCASRRGPPARRGRHVAITACGGVSSRSHCASIMRSTCRALASCGSGVLVALSINASRSTSQRSTSPAIARESALSSALRTSFVAEPSAMSSVSPRRRTASSRRRAARRAWMPVG